MDFVVVKIKVEKCADCPFVIMHGNKPITWEIEWRCTKTNREVPQNVVASDCPERTVRATAAELARYYSQ